MVALPPARRRQAQLGLRISTRQREILGFAADGQTDKEIAALLSLSVSTVRTHLERFYLANGVRNRSQAIAVYFRFGLHRVPSESSGKMVGAEKHEKRDLHEIGIYNRER